MLKLRHFLQPVRSLRTVMMYVRMYSGQRRLSRQFKHLPRDMRETCWCGGKLTGETLHSSYRKCGNCGGCVNFRPIRESDLGEVYSLKAYWQDRQRARSSVSIEERSELYRKDGRVAEWLKIIDDFAPREGTAVEIGCAPGVLLAELQNRGFKVKGVEVDAAVSAWISENMKIEMATGLFPDVSLPPADVFLALDVLEHVPHPDEFMRAASELTRPGGIVVIQTPIDRGGSATPFARRPDLFDDLEHLFLFTDRGMELLAERSGLQIIDNGRQLWEAGEICVFRKI